MILSLIFNHKIGYSEIIVVRNNNIIYCKSLCGNVTAISRVLRNAQKHFLLYFVPRIKQAVKLVKPVGINLYKISNPSEIDTQQRNIDFMIW